MPCLELLPVFLDNQEQHSNVMIPAFGRLEVIFEHRLLPEPHSLTRPQGWSGRVRSQRYLRLELLQAQLLSQVHQLLQNDGTQAFSLNWRTGHNAYLSHMTRAGTWVAVQGCIRDYFIPHLCNQRKDPRVVQLIRP